MQVVAIDFESYYDKEYSIKTMGPDAYVADGRFDPYLVSIYCEDFQYVGPVEDADWSKITGMTAIAHNARFDKIVFDKCKDMGLIPHVSQPKGWHCTADLACFLQAPRDLEGAVDVLLGVKLDKRTRKKMDGLTLQQAREKGMEQELLDYCLNDAKYCYEIWKQESDKWPELEMRLSVKNREDSIRGVAIDVPKLEQYIEEVQLVMWEAAKNIPWDWSNRKTPLSPKLLAEQCRKVGIVPPKSLAQDSVECQQWEDKYGEEYPWVGAMRDWRRGNAVLKKLQRIKVALRDDNIYPYTIKYFGGHTGRWSGGGGFNMQNIYRDPVELGGYSWDFRSLIVARPGKVLYITDLSQIEARILLWLADDLETLVKIAEGFSVYEAHAIATMGWEVQDQALNDADPKTYAYAKARVLGLGYGCGWKRFVELAWTLAKLRLTAAESKVTVTDFRASNPKITALWRSLDSYLQWSVGDTFELELASGRTLSYFNVRRSSSGLKVDIVREGYRSEHTYGGKLTENAVQAIARDFFAEKMLELEDAGFVQLWHVHDEYILEVDEDADHEKVVAEIRALISAVPDWLKGCPIDSKTNISHCYLK